MNIKRGVIFAVLAALWPAGFFFVQDCSASGAIVINEIAWAGSAVSANHEWIELKNLSSSEVSLDGWKLKARDDSPKISLSGSIPAEGYFLLERTNDDSSPASAEMFYAGSLSNGGEWLELFDASGSLVDSIDFSSGWTAGDNSEKRTAQRCGESWSSAFGTPGASNGCGGSSAIEAVPVREEERTVFRFGDLIINEFCPDPGEGEDEWVEIYDPTPAKIILEGWYLADGSGVKTVLSGSLGGEDRFVLIEKPKGALNNAGDAIELYSPEDNLIDRVVYGNWGSSTSSNAPKAAKGSSVALRVDGRREAYFSESFSVSLEPTPGRPNKIVAGDPVEGPSADPSSPLVAMTEIYPNPVGSDREDEFIEFHNQGDKEVDLSLWRLEIEGGKTLEFGRNFLSAPKIPAGSFFVLWRRESLAALDNGGGVLRWFSPLKKAPVQILEYPALDEGESFVDSQAIASSSSALTKKFIINALSLDRWVKSGLPTPGAYNEIWSENRAPRAVFSLPDTLATGTVLIFDASDSVDEDGDELSFRWDFGDGSSAAGETAAHIFSSVGDYRIRLLVDDGRSSDFLEKTAAFYPNQRNALSSPVVREDSDIQNESRSASFAWPLGQTWTSSFDRAGSGTVALSDFHSLKVGVEAQVSASVLVEPGIFGRQYFYVVSAGSPALKIYNYYGEFPVLRQGDEVIAKGEVAGGEEKYLKIAESEDVAVVGAGVLPIPETVDEVLSIDDVGRFIEMKGVIKKADAKIFLASDSGQTRIFLKNPNSLSAADFPSGRQASVRGLVLSVSSAPALVPRGAQDISFDQESEEPPPESSDSSASSSLNEKSREWVLPARKSDGKAMIYALVLALGAALMFAGLWLRGRKKEE